MVSRGEERMAGMATKFSWIFIKYEISTKFEVFFVEEINLRAKNDLISWGNSTHAYTHTHTLSPFPSLLRNERLFAVKSSEME